MLLALLAGWLSAWPLGAQESPAPAADAAASEDAGPLGGTFEVASASVINRRGVWELSAHVRYPQNERIRSALRDGVTLSFDLEVSITRQRRLWFDAEVLDLNLRRELTYHVVSDRYLLSRGPGQDIETFPTIEAALARLGDISDWPIIVDSQLGGDGPWRVSVRASVRRGRMPDALRALVFWSDAWHRTSEWYRWTLPR
ncbi:MAG: DUF4390 domain-containing protein [Gammaproteobacteria bacterium]|nr:DUF4390 domain-containing protein [Gammaproteobacteria bacterium]